MRPIHVMISASALCLSLTACASDTPSSDTPSSDTPSTDSAPDVSSAALPDVPSTGPPDTNSPSTVADTTTACISAPFAIEAQRVGSSPIGAADFVVTDAVVTPIPIVPDPDQTLDPATKAGLAASTDVLGYSFVFANEALSGVGGFVDTEPSAAGAIRGQLSIFPSTPTPFAVDDVVTYGEASGLSFPLPTIGLDLVAFDDSTNSYLDEPTGQVTILAITDEAICVDVDLEWTNNRPADNVVTVRGIITGRLLGRSTLFTLG